MLWQRALIPLGSRQRSTGQCSGCGCSGCSVRNSLPQLETNRHFFESKMIQSEHLKTPNITNNHVLCQLHVIEGETLESPLIETFLFTLIKAVHRLQSLDELVPQSCSTSNLTKAGMLPSLSKDTCLKVSPVPQSQCVR